jgi:hypothetical protein
MDVLIATCPAYTPVLNNYAPMFGGFPRAVIHRFGGTAFTQQRSEDNEVSNDQCRGEECPMKETGAEIGRDLQ